MIDPDDTPNWPAPHYSGEHQPNQHEPGERAPIPVSHIDGLPAKTLNQVLDACDYLEQTSRAYRTGRDFQRLRARLMWFAERLERIVSEVPNARTPADYLRRVRHPLGIRPAPPTPKTD